MNKIFYTTCFLLLFNTISNAQNLAVLKYEGGGDWYSNPTALKNLIEFCNNEINTKMNIKPAVVAAEDVEIFEYPMLHMTGHGNVFFSDAAIKNLKNYVLGGGVFTYRRQLWNETFSVTAIGKTFS